MERAVDRIMEPSVSNQSSSSDSPATVSPKVELLTEDGATKGRHHRAGAICFHSAVQERLPQGPRLH
ncbi:hypothetical protein GQ55_9G495200 [Panicum hallii var. hallii]|uniref:Uncharacterized protein n=1 Tax=Panicum hallii var. hallii TaxID=1504633 RepID=A0A2T7CDC6_9POAL|nr:hypothetical protein GQ55_9G495200 [Panicum hallii var. hallii]